MSASPYGLGAMVGGAVVYGPQPRPMSMNGGQGQGQGQGMGIVSGQGQGQVPPMKVKGAKKSVRSGGSTPADRGNNELVDVPAQLFYPFYPETQVGSAQNGAPGSAPGSATGSASGSTGGSGGQNPNANHTANSASASASASAQQRDYSGLLAAAAAANTYGYQSSQESFVSEERDPKLSIQQQQGMQMWVNAVSWVC
jgi:hypothetical protein